MAEWKNQPLDNEQFNKVVEAHAKVVSSGALGIIQALERNTAAVLTLTVELVKARTGNATASEEGIERSVRATFGKFGK